jgi:hypothetical protein
MVSAAAHAAVAAILRMNMTFTPFEAAQVLPEPGH